MPGLLLTLKEAAAEYGVSPSRMSRLVRRADLATHPNPADRRSKLVYRADVGAALRPEEQRAGHITAAQAIRIIRGETPDGDLPAEGSLELRSLMHEWLEGTRKARAMLAGHKLIPSIEALRIVRGEDPE